VRLLQLLLQLKELPLHTSRQQLIVCCTAGLLLLLLLLRHGLLPPLLLPVSVLQLQPQLSHHLPLLLQLRPLAFL
jgi:hypothetical protein